MVSDRDHFADMGECMECIERIPIGLQRLERAIVTKIVTNNNLANYSNRK